MRCGVQRAALVPDLERNKDTMVPKSLFPKWVNALPTLFAVGGLGGFVAVVGGTWYWATPSFWEVGYMPTQPGEGFNHQIHAGKLGMDCRYCHTKIESSSEANIPNVATCMGCHEEGRLSPDFDPGEKVAFVRTAYEQDESIPWSRVHKLPDYVRNFPHAPHLKAGVSCLSCHGQITAMPEVYQAEPISMGWCLECHRDVENNPQDHLTRPDKITDLRWVEQEWFANSDTHAEEARQIFESLDLSPPENCGACHH